ncbi:TonB-dependent receptor [Sphingobium sp. CR2-8]|uniref:TonB-dependent receptor n=1 Tax=Sphingobium sp. CR2-8 TaxID=1306534 RepID=UPI002DB9C553|nr:TonB-dependent receptor [Sphingobium sp. CR2-8]MEC3911831.1 TonB-dependent receptor [Sphingobium sp. CR2-8]
MRQFNKIVATLAGASIIAIAAPAFAQDTAPQQAAQAPDANSDIIVTAQRKAEKVTEVPISITVANQAQLERQQVNTVNDLSRIAPSLEIQQAPGQNTGGGGAIRGIGTQTFSAGAVASVGVVVDQVSQGNANISDLFDVARIEVLKGPQGTLFGLTTSAGVINITTNAPDPTGFSARVRTELSDAGTAGSKFGNQVIQGVVNIPLASNAAVRVSGVTNLRQGVNRNALTGDYNDNDRYGVRGRLLWEPTENLTVNLIGDYTKSRAENGGDFFTFVKTSGPGTALGGLLRDSAGITARLASCGVTPGEGNRNYCSGNSFVGRSENYGGSLQLDYDADPFTLTSVTAYRKSNETGLGAATDVFRGAPLELQVANGAVNRRLSLFTQEFRVSSPADQFLEYTLGAFYSNQKQVRDPETLSVSVLPFPGLVIPIVRNPGADVDIKDELLAFFGQGTFHLTPSLRLIAGGRYTTDRLSLDYYNYAIPANPFTKTVLDVQKFSWRLGAQYDLDQRTMVYATASRGFKGGQIATPAAPQQPFVVQPEIPMAYEAGLKSTLFGGWVADLSVFYQKIKNFQAQQCTVDSTAVISCVQTNIDGVKSRGAEINFFGKVFEGLSLNTGFIYAKATYPKGLLGTDGTNIGNTQLAYAPKYKFTLSGEYEVPVTSRFNGFLAADTVWKSKVRYEANSNPETRFRSHWLVGGRIGVRTDDNRYSIAVFGRNLFNVHEPSLMQSNFPYTTDQRQQNIGAIYGPQSFRQVGISLDAKF